MSDYFAHETACIDSPCTIGKGTRIWHYSHIMAGARIGENCNLGQNVFVAATAVLGNRVKVQNNVSIYDVVTLEDGVFCGPSMVFTNVMNPRAEIERKSEYMSTLVRQGATIGANATIVCGTTIGAYAFVGAGAVVTRDIPDYAVAYGSPAKVESWVSRHGMKLAFDSSARATCSATGEVYRKVDENKVILESGD